MKAKYFQYFLNFHRPSGTSRGVLTAKETWFVVLEQDGKTGIGECGLFRGLSCDDVPAFEDKLKWSCENIDKGLLFLLDELIDFPSIRFGLEQAFMSLNSENPFILFDNKFSHSHDRIKINGLIWMGDKDFMRSQIVQKLDQGFDCIKLKIGAIDFDTELRLLASIRKEFSAEEIEIRVDANGAFDPKNALEKLKQLSEYQLHSIEQPIRQGQYEDMARLCETTPVSIALDEELIGVHQGKEELLDQIKPQYIILKPSLLGGFKASEEWIALVETRNIQWWNTSALESNIGLNAIAQWTYGLESELPQGLGTGQLYDNNFESPLIVNFGHIEYSREDRWDLLEIMNILETSKDD